MPEGTHEAKKPAADVDTLVAGSSPDAAVLAGRSPLPSQLAGPSSSAYVNKGPACEANPELAQDRASCFLEKDTRTRLITQFQLRVMNAKTNFQAACGKLDLAKRLEGKHTDIPWYVGLMLDVIGAFAGNTIGNALTQVRSSGLEHLARIGGEILVQRPDVPNWATVSFNALAAVKPTQLTSNINRFVNTVKKEGMSAAQDNAGSVPVLPTRAGEEQKPLSFIEMLELRANESFACIREKTPAIASDADLLVLFEAFADPRHTEAAYQRAIKAKLDRFKTSGVSKVGRNIMDPRDHQDRHLSPSDGRRRDPIDPDNARHGPPAGGAREKKVVWVVYGSGAPGHYGYAHRDWGPSTIITAPLEQSLRDEETTTAVPYYAGPVPDEFVEMAVQRQLEVWGAAPEPFVIFEHQFPFWYLSEPDRIVRSRQQFESQLSGVRRLLGGGDAGTAASNTRAPAIPSGGLHQLPRAQPQPERATAPRRTTDPDWGPLPDASDPAGQRCEPE